MVRRFVLVVSLLGVGAFTALARPAGAAPPENFTGQVTATEGIYDGNYQLNIGSQTLASSKGGPATATFSATVTWPNPFPSDGAIGTPSTSTLTIGSNTFDLAMNPGSALKNSTFSFTETFQGLTTITKIKGTITGVSQSAITGPPSTAIVDVSLTVK